MDDGKRALWTRVVSDLELSGLSQREFAEQKKLELSNLRYWVSAGYATTRARSRPRRRIRQRQLSSARRRRPQMWARVWYRCLW